MGTLRAGALIGIAVMVSGCAGLHPNQSAKRLEAQVALLDQRVGQLERYDQNPSLAQPIAPLFDTSIAGQSVTTVKQSKPKTTVAKSPSGTFIKPSTTQIQQSLKNAGFYQGSVDGKNGPLTRGGVREFQRMNGLKDDGIVGKRTWAELQIYSDMGSFPSELSQAGRLK